MLDFYLNWENLASKGLKTGSEVEVIEGEFNRIIILGVGGSGVIGEFVHAVSKEYDFNVRIDVARYLWDLKGLKHSKTLVIAVSYSGNTTETLECTKYFLSRGTPVIGITSDGLLKEMLVKRGLPVAPIPSGLLPRAAMPVMLYACLGLISKMGLTGKLTPDNIMKSIDMLKLKDAAAEEADKLINIIGEKTPVIIAVNKYYSLALRIKQELAENSKKLSFIETLPDAGHNSVVPWGRDPSKKNYVLIAISGGGEEDIYYEAFSNGCGEHLEKLVLKGEGYLDKIIWGAWIAGIASVKLALKNGYDPSETREIKGYRSSISGLIKL